jgi:hypothetical protein
LIPLEKALSRPSSAININNAKSNVKPGQQRQLFFDESTVAPTLLPQDLWLYVFSFVRFDFTILFNLASTCKLFWRLVRAPRFLSAIREQLARAHRISLLDEHSTKWILSEEQAMAHYKNAPVRSLAV